MKRAVRGEPRACAGARSRAQDAADGDGEAEGEEGGEQSLYGDLTIVSPTVMLEKVVELSEG